MSSSDTIDREKEWYEILSDDVMLHILSYVNADTLYNVSRLDNRLNILVCTKRLWRYIDGRSRAPPDRSRKLAAFSVQHMHEQTRTLLLAGRSRFKRLFRSMEWVFSEPDYSTLSVLALENQRLPICATLRMFPKSLLELSLRNSYNDNCITFFKLSHDVMANLRVLVLDGCRWVRTCMLLSVGKFPKLQVLSMVRCTKLQDSDVYVSLAANFGFASLRVLDVRHTRFGDSMVSAMVLHKRELHSLYFASYSSVFYPDIMKQMKQQQEQQTWREHGRLECVGAQLDYDERKNSQRTKLLVGTSVDHKCYGQSFQDVTDEVGIYFARLRHDGGDMSSSDDVTEYHSLLYKNPYGGIDCPCVELARMPHYDPPKDEVFPDRPICVVRDDSHLDAESSSSLIRSCTTNKFNNDALHRRQRLYEISVPIPNDWNDYSSRMILLSRVNPFLPGLFEDFSIRGEGRVSIPFKEVPGDEYEACCLAYNTAAHEHYNLPPSSVTTSSHRCRSRTTTNSRSSSSNDSNNTCATSDSIIQQRKRKRADESSDSSSSSDDYDCSYRTTSPRPKAKRRLKRTRRREKQPSLSIEVTPRLDRAQGDIDNDQPRVIEVHQIEYNEAANRNPMQLVGEGNAIQIIPVVEFNATISSKLKQLSLRGFKKITDATLESLEHLTDLRILDVTGTRVTRQGILRFLSTNPHCHVIHQSCCRCHPLLHL